MIVGHAAVAVSFVIESDDESFIASRSIVRAWSRPLRARSSSRGP
jgi:hypothetical protein